MQRDLDRLVTEEFDVLVVGGGIFGVATAWEAINRGLSVALIEAHDFVHATSANCFKVIHGGVRYMQHGDVPRVRSSVAERSTFLRVAPHLATPLPIVVPTYGKGKEGKAFLSTGMFAYEMLTADRNRGIADKQRHIPGHTTFSREETLEQFPWLETDELTGAVLFYDAQMYSPERLGLAFALSAAKEGAALANYVAAKEFIRDGDSVTGVVAEDRLTGDRLKIRAKTVVNAAGPWAERLLDDAPNLSLKHASTFSRDAWFLVRRPWVSELSLAVQARTKDPDALLARSARHLFVVPWRGHTLIGVWHVVTDVHPDEVTVPDADLEGFLDELNWACPGLDIKLDEVGAWNAGLVLFGENTDGGDDLSYGKRSRLIDHSVEHGVEGLLTLIGVRYTTARGEAERALNLVEKKLGRRPAKSMTKQRVLVGGDISDYGKHQRTVADALGCDPQDPTARSLAANYGSRFLSVLKAADTKSVLPNTHVLEAEVRYVCRHEMATRLEDIVMRRTEIADGCHPGDECLEYVAGIAAEELGWDQQRKNSEIEMTNRALEYRRYRRVGAKSEA